MNLDFGTLVGGTVDQVFITYFSYAPDGSQKYYIIGGRYVPNSELARARTGVIGQLADVAIATTSGGEAVGGPYHPNATQVLDLPLSLVWTSPRRATLTIGTSSWSMVAASFNGDDSNLVAGRWDMGMHVAASFGDGFDSGAMHFTVDLNPAGFGTAQVTVSPDSAPGLALPPATAKWFLATCVAKASDTKTCPLYGLALSTQTYPPSTQPGTVQPPTLAVWFDPPTGRAGVELLTNVTATGARLGPDNWHFDLYVQPEFMQAHGIYQWSKDVDYTPTQARRLSSTLYFSRVPAYMKDYVPQ